MQPKGWAFDLAAHEAGNDQLPRILGEVKKTVPELEYLKDDLLGLSNGASTGTVSNNSAKKWQALLATKPRLVWLVGPDEHSYVYSTSFSRNSCSLQEVNYSALAFSVT